LDAPPPRASPRPPGNSAPSRGRRRRPKRRW
jgi:hypothetical protein